VRLSSLASSYQLQVLYLVSLREQHTGFSLAQPEGGYLLTPYDPCFEEKMTEADDIISRYRKTDRASASCWSNPQLNPTTSSNLLEITGFQPPNSKIDLCTSL
jgi:hypothetical protein